MTTPPVNKPVRTLLIDDQRIFSDSLAMALEMRGIATAVGQFTDGDQALAALPTLDTQLVLLDLAMPGKPGRVVFEELRAQHPALPVIVMSGQVSIETFAELWERGVNALVQKDEPLDSLSLAIQRVMSGRRYISEGLKNEIRNLANAQGQVSLTPRERQVLSAIAEGLANKQIAGSLGIGLPTVRTHRENLMAKIDAHSTADIIRYAMRTGLVVQAESA